MPNILNEILDELEQKYADSSIELLFKGIIQDFSGRVALLSSFGAEAAILLYYASQVDKGFPVIFLNTQKLFDETIEYKELLVEKFGLTNVKNIYPDYVDLSRNDPDGDLWRKDAKQCCTIRKVIPLGRALQNYDAWITGRKRYHGGIRSHLPFVEKSDGKIKINPLADWTKEDIVTFFKDKKIPPHPLVASGYTSIGCTHCTNKREGDNDPRGGRWAGQDKEECGIHLNEDGKFTPNKKSR